MAFIVKSAGLVTTGTTGADLFSVNSGAVAKTTILGLAGNDSILIADGISTATSLLVDAAGDKDVLTLSGGLLSSSTVKGGAGADNVDISLTNFNAGVVNGGGGNDSINISGAGDAGVALSAASITLGGGRDVLVLSAAAGSKTTIAAGAGADTITLGLGTMSSSTVFGGGGADNITVSGTGGGGLLINADSTENGGGADTITFEGRLSSSTINAKGGKDVINVVTGGVVGTGSKVLGNAGADVITISGNVAGSANLIGGGAGADTITLSGSLGGKSSIQGGGGKDVITFSGLAASSQIFGGDAADTLTFDGAAADFAGQIAYGAFSESTLSKMDTVSGIGASKGGTGAIFAVSAVTTTLTTGVVGGGTGFSGATLSTEGYVRSSQFSTAGNVTARAALIDGQTQGKGATVVFEASDANYLFIQGGSTGTADDLVVKIGSAANQAVSVEIKSAQITIG
jgi:hypothetical protein